MKHDLSKFAAKRPAPAPAETSSTSSGKAARGTAKRPAIAVRPWSQDDWIAMQAFALQQRKSLNQLLLEGFAAQMQAAGVKPISTEEPK
jgi:hypothetical protein